jgi:mannose-6-phosphate isomerase-like protein (cupin superfamily)
VDPSAAARAARAEDMVMLRPTSADTSRGSAVSEGAALTFETLVATEGERAPTRVRTWDDTLLRVIAGTLRLTVDEEERLLGAGEEAIVPAGVPHRIRSAAGEARFVAGFRRAQR